MDMSFFFACATNTAQDHNQSSCGSDGAAASGKTNDLKGLRQPPASLRVRVTVFEQIPATEYSIAGAAGMPSNNLAVGRAVFESRLRWGPMSISTCTCL